MKLNIHNIIFLLLKLLKMISLEKKQKVFHTLLNILEAKRLEILWKFLEWQWTTLMK